MLRKIIAGTAVAGALTLGFVGAAGATTSGSSTGNPGSLKAILCADLPQIQSKVQAVESTVNSGLIPQLQALETQAKNAGHTKLADRIGKRVTAIQNRETKVNARLTKGEAKCQAVQGANTGTNG